MSTVAQLVRDALMHLGVIDAVQPIKPQDSADAIRALNMMVRRWEADGLALGWVDVESPSNTLPGPPEAEEAIGYNLALRLQARFSTQASSDVIAFAQMGMSSLRADIASRDAARLSYDLPGAARGSRLDDFLAGD